MVEAISPRSQKIVEWYERRLAPVAFIIGFVFDSITFTRVDFLFDHVILIGHLLIAASGIVLVNAHAQGRLHPVRSIVSNGFAGNSWQDSRCSIP